MKRPKRKHARKPVGAPPGLILPAPDAPPPDIRLMAYGPDQLVDEPVCELSRIPDYLGKFPVVWVDVDGLGDAETIRRIGELFNLHPLALEDATHTQQRAKVEEYDQHLFIVARMLASEDHAETEQISL